jgi:site-specific recombinase XerD
MLHKFEAHLRSVNMSENTVKSYGKDLRQFLDFIESRGIEVQDVDHAALLQFLGYLTDRGLKSSTKRRRMEAVKTFYRAMCRMGELKENPMADFEDMPRVEESNVRFLREEEYRNLRDVVRESRRKSSVRDYAILEMALQTGLRISEICSLPVDDIEFSTRTTIGHVRVRRGKGGKERMVTLNDAAERALKAYLDVRPKGTGHKEVFLNNRLKPCDPVVISAVFKRYMKRVGINDASFHALRHTFATHRLKKGTDIKIVQDALGHKSLTTTEKYVHFMQEMMDRQLKDAL